MEDALKLVKWYTWRWLIEELFRILKSEGLGLQQTQLSKGKAIKRLTLMALPVALQILQLKQDRQNQASEAASIIFSKQQLSFLQALVPTLEGKTEAQKNHYPPYSLAWAAWIVARLAGWKAGQKDSLSGVISLKRGMKEMKALFQGWLLAKNMDFP